MALSGDDRFWGRASRFLAFAVVCATVASCASTKDHVTTRKKRSKEYFAESEYGVKASPRVHYGRNVPKGGGRDITGKPYKVKGKWYVPKEDKKYDKMGLASWYGSAFHGRLTANGEIYDQYGLSAAHPTFPLPSYARVTNLETGDSVVVRVNDRGPYDPGRIIDLSDKAAEMLEVQNKGTANVRVQYVGRARMDGKDMPFLMASFVRKGERLKRFSPGGEIATGVMVASNEKRVRIPKDTHMDDGVDYSATATALVDSPRSAVVASFDVMEQYAELPEFGPIPRERPMNYEPNNGALSAYAEMPVEASSSPFDKVLTASGKLDAESIRASVKRRKNTMF
ncbi:MAG: septal ring lytic transglycosylase RlpA family protein [Rhizobium sp.]|nr:septal ring lytic transglycosylase RlpA family protein [Rhizobium sp.]